MEQSVFDNPQPAQPFNRFAIPVKWGIIWGVLSCIITTVQHMFLLEPYAFYLAIFFIQFVLGLVFYCVAGIQQRKAMGGYITFKDAFQAIFVVIVISSIITAIYSFVYFKWIDPGVMDQLKEQTLSSMEKWGAPTDSIDEAAENFDKGKDGSVGTMLLNLCKGLIISSIFGFICAAIVKKKKPEFGAS